MSLDVSSDLVTLLRAVVDIESVSGNEARLADEVEHVLRAQPHLTVDRLGDTVIARTPRGNAQRVVIAGHLDTVPVAGNLPSWVADGRVYGRGTCDMKGGVAVALKVACATSEPTRDVTWIFYDNEEVEATKNGLGRVARERPDLLAADFAVLMEPTGAVVEGGCQGTLRFILETRGLAAHSARAWLGHNAIHDMADVFATLQAYVPPTVGVDGLDYREGLNAVGITGGIAGNVIPDVCRMEINYRFAPDKSVDEAEAFVRALFGGHQLELTDASPGARPGLDQPAAAGFLAAVGGIPRPKFGWTDVSRFSELGVPAVNFGPADPGKAHADDEFCPIDDLATCHDALVRWLTSED
ncbi:MAG TPA: succinyl-diaminopimelate desuccinylase [Propionibacteriaceae bacterium]|nr:succinyl-diaminopimelate desuccinylase [Propionibacteriaceae bacterium]